MRTLQLATALTLASIGGGIVAGSAQSAPRQVSTIVAGGTVVTVDGARNIYNPGAIAIEGTTIVAVGPAADIAARFTAAERIDTVGSVVIPGLVNAHTHAPMVLYRGLADDLRLQEWLERYIFPAEAKTVSRELVRAGTRLAALEMIQSGTTAFADMYYFEEEIARTTKAAGMRGVLGQTIIQFPVADAKTPEEGLARAEAFIKEFAKDDLIVPAVAPHSPYTLDTKNLQASRALATKYGVPVLIHVAETEGEIQRSQKAHRGMSPVAYLQSIDFLGPRTVANHGVWVNAADMTILRSQKVAISHNPESNMKLGSGIAPVPEYLVAGVTVSLGTDGAASNNDLDMFEAMRFAALLHKAKTRDPRVIPAATALEMATMGGARALGLEAQIGSLEAGKRADLAVVSMASARTTPLYDPVSHLVYVTRGEDVRTVMVNGRVLMRDRKMLMLDEPAVLAEARKIADAVRAAVGK
ncbi:MAG TPA: amidohydrolase [Vicinamibacterales bacterium]|nr:amidohydrolase [Vicinamibacterales bacterium]